MRLNLKKLSLICLSFVGISCVSSAVLADSWGPLVELRDNSEMFPDGKPSGGWWVTPIHATLLADGKVLVSGWGRRDHDNCAMFGTRKTGTSFVLDPNSLNNGGTLNIQPLHEAQQSGTADVIYCSGHTPISDGRVLFTGGARYENLGDFNQHEFGLNYGRMYLPSTNNFFRIASPMTGGVPGTNATAWYPTNTRLPDGRVMVAGGFSRCCEGNFSNRSLQFFDPIAQDQFQNPWSVLASHDSVPTDLNPGLRDYIHSFVLPTPVTVNGLARQVAFIGSNGRIMLANTDPNTPSNLRFTSAPNGLRAFNAEAWDATAALVSTGEIMTMGGTADGGTAQRIDLYNPVTGSTRSIDTGVGRRNPSSVLLPDGTVLLLNGGNDDRNFGGDRRRPQIVNLETGSVSTMEAWTNDGFERGYHSFALLLKDGRVLIGGGISPLGNIGCERPDVRIYSPSYLTNGPRPVVNSAPASITMQAAGSSVQLSFSGASLKASEQGGVVLMALGSTTHSFDQNQRYVRLPYVQNGSTLTIAPPANNNIAPPGDYIMYLVSQAGVPSVGITVRVEKAPSNGSSSSSASSVPALALHVRGTHNGWVEGDLMTLVSGSMTNYEACRNFSAGDAGGGPRFKIDPNGAWGDGFPAADISASGWTKVVVDGNAKTVLSVTTNLAANCGVAASSSSAVSSSVAATSSAAASSSSVAVTPFHLRGTHNGWVEGDLFTPVAGSTTNLENCRNFTAGDGGGGPRFKVDPNGGWGDAFPAADVVASGWTKVVINGTTKSIVSVTTNLAADCGVAASSSSVASSIAPSSSSVASVAPSSSSSSVAISSIAASSSSVAVAPFHLRGTHNGWLEGDLFTAVAGSTTNLENCRNFTVGDGGGGPRFKVDPNGGWGDAFPAADVVASGWTKVVINSSTKTIVSVTTNLAANCGVAVSSSSVASSVASSLASSVASSIASSVASSVASSAASSSVAAIQIILKPTVTTTTGQSVFVVGNQPQLSNWNSAAGVPCTIDAGSTTAWTCQGFTLTPGISFSYKYIKRDTAGNVVWESGADRVRTAPSVTTTFSETWK